VECGWRKLSLGEDPSQGLALRGVLKHVSVTAREYRKHVTHPQTADHNNVISLLLLIQLMKIFLTQFVIHLLKNAVLSWVILQQTNHVTPA
jgi:hypothetical protein